MKWLVAMVLMASTSLWAADKAEYTKGTLIAESTFDCSKSLADWVMEGPGLATVEEGKMVLKHEFEPEIIRMIQAGTLKRGDHVKQMEKMYLPKYPQWKDKAYSKGGFRGYAFNIWHKTAAPDNFVLEFDFQPLSLEPLHMVNFCGMGLKGEDIFDPSLAPRFGLAKEIMNGDVRTYRISYCDPVRPTANMRRAPGRAMVAQGPEPIGDVIGQLYKMKVIVWKGTVSYVVDGEHIFSFTDKKPFKAGSFGFRLMTLAKGAYDNIRLFELVER